MLSLDARVRKWVEEGQLSPGHARTLIGVDGAYEKAKKIIAKNLSVREAEKLARPSGSTRSSGTGTKRPQKDVDTIDLERDLRNHLGLKVRIDGAGPKGVLRIAYNDLDQLDLVIAKLKAGHPYDPAPVTLAPGRPKPKLSVSVKPKR